MPAKIGDEYLAELNSRVDIEDLVSSYVTLKGRGSRLVGLCPFHNEKTGSFTVFRDTNSYYCFGCGAGGGPITFVRQIESLDFFEAVKLLSERVGMEIPDGGFDDSMHKLKSRIYEINRETARFFHNYLYSEKGKKILDYYKSRGLSAETINHFGLGASPDGWDELLNHLKSNGYTLSEMYQANIIMKNSRGGYYDRFRGRAMFPIIDLRGNVIAFGGRAIPPDDKSGAKYINTSDTPVFKKSKTLFALNFAKNSCRERIFFCEGYLDVIALHSVGITNAVAALGTAVTEEHAALLSRYTGEVVLTLDADAAGKKATDRAIGIFSKSGVSVKVLTVPDGKDPDEFLRNHKNSKEAFLNLLKGTVNSIEYKLIDAAEGLQVNTDSGRIEYLKRCSDILASVHDNIAVDLYAGRLSDKFGISKTAILTEVSKREKSLTRREEKKHFREIVSPKFTKDEITPEKRGNLRAVKAEEIIISILIYNPDFMEKHKDDLSEDLFISEFNKKVFLRILEVHNAGLAFDVAMLGDDFTPEESGRVSIYQNRAVKGENAEKEFSDCVKVLKNEKQSLNVATDGDEWINNIKRIANNKKNKK